MVLDRFAKAGGAGLGSYVILMARDLSRTYHGARSSPVGLLKEIDLSDFIKLGDGQSQKKKPPGERWL